MSSSGIRITGIGATRRMLTQTVPKTVAEAELAALIKGGLLIQRDSQKMTPVLYGKLKGSAYTAWKSGATSADGGNTDAAVVAQSKANCMASKEPMVEVGHSAAYAIYVHENLQARHGPARTVPGPGGPNQQAKFLEKAFNGRKATILRMVTRAINRATNALKPSAGGTAP